MMLLLYDFRLGFLANARFAKALRAASLILLQRRLLQINPALARQTCEPGENVSELAGKFVPVLMANTARQFADFLSEPTEGAIQTALTVLRQVNPFNQRLEFVNCHAPNYLECTSQVNRQTQGPKE